MKPKNLLAILLGLLLLLAAVANVAVPRAAAQIGGEHPAAQPLAVPGSTLSRLTYQGRLTNSSGVPINTAVDVVFRLYTYNGSVGWTSATRTITPVNGLFTVYLGDLPDPPLYVPGFAATIGVTVGSDPEMTPRQPLNTVVGFAPNSPGVYGSSMGDTGVFGISNTGDGVLGYSNAPINGALAGFNAASGVLGPALELRRGSIKVTMAGVDTATPVFMHQVVTGSGSNICPGVLYATVISNTLTNNNPNAILFVTPNYRSSDATQSDGAGPAADIPAVFYSVNSRCGAANDNKWVIYNLKSTAMVNNTYYNVMVIVP